MVFVRILLDAFPYRTDRRVTEKSTIFLEVPADFYKTVWDRSKEVPMPTTILISSSVSIELRLVTDTDGQGRNGQRRTQAVAYIVLT